VGISLERPRKVDQEAAVRLGVEGVRPQFEAAHAVRVDVGNGALVLDVLVNLEHFQR